MMIYLASPYTHSDPAIMLARFEAAERFVARAIARERPIFSPIVHCHALAIKYSMPPEFKYWENYNLAMLGAAEELWVLKLTGWEDSKGVMAEIDAAEITNKFITFIGEDYFPCR